MHCARGRSSSGLKGYGMTVIHLRDRRGLPSESSPVGSTNNREVSSLELRLHESFARAFNAWFGGAVSGASDFLCPYMDETPAVTRAALDLARICKNESERAMKGLSKAFCEVIARPDDAFGTVDFDSSGDFSLSVMDDVDVARKLLRINIRSSLTELFSASLAIFNGRCVLADSRQGGPIRSDLPRIERLVDVCLTHALQLGRSIEYKGELGGIDLRLILMRDSQKILISELREAFDEASAILTEAGIPEYRERRPERARPRPAPSMPAVTAKHALHNAPHASGATAGHSPAPGGAYYGIPIPGPAGAMYPSAGEAARLGTTVFAPPMVPRLDSGGIRAHTLYGVAPTMPTAPSSVAGSGRASQSGPVQGVYIPVPILVPMRPTHPVPSASDARDNGSRESARAVEDTGGGVAPVPPSGFITVRTAPAVPAAETAPEHQTAVEPAAKAEPAASSVPPAGMPAQPEAQERPQPEPSDAPESAPGAVGDVQFELPLPNAEFLEENLPRLRAAIPFDVQLSEATLLATLKQRISLAELIMRDYADDRSIDEDSRALFESFERKIAQVSTMDVRFSVSPVHPVRMAMDELSLYMTLPILSRYLPNGITGIYTRIQSYQLEARNCTFARVPDSLIPKVAASVALNRISRRNAGVLLAQQEAGLLLPRPIPAMEEFWQRCILKVGALLLMKHGDLSKEFSSWGRIAERLNVDPGETPDSGWMLLSEFDQVMELLDIPKAAREAYGKLWKVAPMRMVAPLAPVTREALLKRLIAPERWYVFGPGDLGRATACKDGFVDFQHMLKSDRKRKLVVDDFLREFGSGSINPTNVGDELVKLRRAARSLLKAA